MYTALGNDKKVFGAEHKKADLKSAVNAFLGESCEDLRFSREKSAGEDREKGVFLGTSLRKRQIPYNMQMDIDRLCLAHAAGRFLDSKPPRMRLTCICAIWRCLWGQGKGQGGS